MSTPDPRSQMLSELAQCAHRLGMAFGGEAERAESHERRMDYFHLFDRCFFAVRVATALQLRLRRAPAEGRAEAEAERAETLDRETDRDPPDREAAEADRERDREPASLPVFLRTLNDVSASASALPGPAPAELPTLRELLARVTADTAPAARPRPTASDLRARLAGSATAQALTLPPRPGPSRPALPGLPLRRATGPPRR